MPRVKPLGSEVMKAGTEARQAGKNAVPKPDAMSSRIKALQAICGFDQREKLAAAVGISADRLSYIIRCPDTCKLIEAVSLQAMADRYNMIIFDQLKAGGAKDDG